MTEKTVYRANHECKRSATNKTRVILTCVSLAVLLLIGGTIAFLVATDTPVENIFNPSTVTSQVVETFEDDVKKDVKIQNTGDTEAYIRASIIVTWKDGANGNVYGHKPVAGTDYTINLNDAGWFQGTDGYYYFKSPVAPNGLTTNLINTCAPVDGKTPEGYGLNVEILCSAIQSLPVKVVNNNWPAVIVGDDGVLNKVG